MRPKAGVRRASAEVVDLAAFRRRRQEQAPLAIELALLPMTFAARASFLALELWLGHWRALAEAADPPSRR